MMSFDFTDYDGDIVSLFSILPDAQLRLHLSTPHKLLINLF